MKILVVDDERDIQELFEQRFSAEIESKQAEFVFAFSGEEALSVLNNLEHQAVLILSDINMPGMSGLQLLEKVKQRYKTPPPIVIMITAYSNEDNLRVAKNLGADDFLSKPVDFRLLKAKLKLNQNG